MPAEQTSPDSSNAATSRSTARILAGQARCKVCQSADRVRIELAMVRGAGKRAASKMYGVSEASVWRHWTNHVSDKLKAARRVSILKPGADLDALVNEESVGVLDHLKTVRAALLWQFDQATQLEDRQGMAVLAAQLHTNLRDVAKLTGELVNRSEVTTKSLLIAPEWMTARSVLISALAPYPEAARAVVTALRQLESAGPTGPVKVIEAATVTHA